MPRRVFHFLILAFLTVSVFAPRAMADCLPPLATADYMGTTDDGYAVVNWSYTFRCDEAYYSTVLIYIDGGSGTLMPTNQSGVIQTSYLSISCTTGPHSFRLLVLPPDWNNYAQAEATYPSPDSRATVSAALGTQPGGRPVFHVSYGFPFTGGSLQRWLGVSWDGGPVTAIEGDLSLSGTVDVTPPYCWHTANFYATPCGNQFPDRNATTGPIDNPTPPVVKGDLALKANTDGTVQVTLNYELPPGFPNGTVDFGALPWFDQGDHRAWGSGGSATLIAGGPQTISVAANAMQGVHNFTELAVLHTECPDVVKIASVECPECQQKQVGDPIAIDDGTMRLSDTDPLPPINGESLRRFYDSAYWNTQPRFFGLGWTSIFDRRLSVYTYPTDAFSVITLSTDDNRTFAFTRGADGSLTESWPTSGNAPDTLTYDAGTQTYAFRQAGSQRVATFRESDGHLVSIRDVSNGRVTSINWDSNGLPTSVTDSWTQVTWIITTSGTSIRRITSIAVQGRPDLVWNYTYTGPSSFYLYSVTGPGGGTWRTYGYQNQGSMLEARDAAGNLIESHTYDSQRHATSSIGPTDQISSIQFGLAAPTPGDTITRVTYGSGSSTDYTLHPLAGTYRTVRIDGGCGSCGARNSSYVYDDRGRVVRRQGGDGFVTTNSYAGDFLQSTTEFLAPAGCDPLSDSMQCRLDTNALAAATLVPTTATRSVSFVYGDANWPDRPTSMTTTSVLQSGGTRTESMTYDAATGTMLSHAISGWTGSVSQPVQEQHGTTTTLYNGTEGAAFNPGGAFNAAWLSLPQPASMRKSVDGPRTDVQDVTTWVYYPIDNSVTPATLRGRLAAIKNAAGHITRFENYDVFGNAQRQIDANGVVTESTFDGIGRSLTTTLKGVAGCDTSADPLCATDLVTSRTYAPALGSIDSQTDANGNVTTYAYDSRGRLATLRRGTTRNTPRESMTYYYDAATGKKSGENYWAIDNNGSSTIKRGEGFSYDSLGQLSAQVHSDNTSTGYTYDSNGTIASVRDENHATPNTFYTYDAAHRLSAVRQTLATVPGGQIATSYTYDVHGNLIRVTDPNGNVTTYQYDDFGRMLSQTSPVTGTTTYSYDAAGNLSSTTDANGAITTRTYDVLSRVTFAASTAGAANESVTWSYDSAQFGLGRLSTISDPAGTTMYAYERRGLPAREAKTLDGTTYTTTYRYDANGNRSTIGYPSGRSATYGFDFANRPFSVSAGATPIITAASYLPFGPMTSLTFGNGTTRSTTFDNRYRVQENKLTGPSSVIADLTYGEDNTGNITAIHDALDARYNRDLGYDDLNRLVTANSGSALWGAGAYTYDSMGNMQTLQVGRSATFSYAGTTPKLASVIDNGVTKTIAYDNAGNETTDAASYSPRNLLTNSGDGAVFGYDGRGVRSSTSLSVTLRAAISISPAALLGGAGATGTLTLNEPAPVGTVVNLSSNNPAVTVPAIVTFSTGAVTATFPVTTSAVPTAITASITATIDTAAMSTSIAVRPVQVNALVLNPTELAGGDAASATLTLSDPAPAATTVVLSSDSSVATVPSTVVVAAGAQTATFNVSTSAVTAMVTATIGATLNGSSQSAQLPIYPAYLQSISNTFSLVGGTSGTITVTLGGVAPAGGATISLASYNSAASVPSSVTIAAGGRSASFTVTTIPVTTAQIAYITATYRSVVKTTTVTVTPPNITSVSVSPSPVVGGEIGTVQATLGAPAPAGTQVTIGGSPLNFVGQPVITFAGGATTAQTGLMTAPVAAPTAVTVSGWYAGTSNYTNTSLTLQPASITLSTLSLNPASLVGTNTSTGTVTLTAPADKDLEIDLTVSDDRVTIPAFVRVPTGAQQATFAISTNAVSSNTNVTVTARHAMTTKTTTLTVQPPAGVVTSSIGVVPALIVGGRNSNGAGTVYLSAAAPASVTVPLTSSDPATASVPASVTVKKGSNNATFTVSTSSVTTAKDVTITAAYGGTIARFRMTVTPANTVVIDSLNILLANSSNSCVGVYARTPCTGTVTLTANAPSGGAVVTLGGRPYIAMPPATVTIPAGSNSATFTLSTSWIPFEKRADVTATYNGITRTYTVDIIYSPQTSLLLEPKSREAVARCASLAIAPCLSGPANGAMVGVMSTLPGKRYSLYTPELNLMAETYATSTAVAYEYIWFAGQPAAQIDNATNTIHYYFNDHLGAPILTTDSTGAVDWRIEREPYGRTFTIRTGADRHQPLSLPGQEDDGSDRSYNIFRWYRAGWGRYTQADPVGVGGRGIDVRGHWQQYAHSSTASTSSFELLERRHAAALYDYAESAPINNTDRVGLKPFKCSLVTMVEKMGPGPYRRCLMVGTCRDYFDWWDVAGTVGLVIVPDCFRCPKRCTAVERGGGTLWYDPNPSDWTCNPWTPIIGFGFGPTGADPF